MSDGPIGPEIGAPVPERSPEVVAVAWSKPCPILVTKSNHEIGAGDILEIHDKGPLRGSWRAIPLSARKILLAARTPLEARKTP